MIVQRLSSVWRAAALLGLLGWAVSAPGQPPPPLPPTPPPVVPPIRFPAQEVGPFRVGLDWLTPSVEVGEPVALRLHYTLARPGPTNRFQLAWNLSHDVVVVVTYRGGQEVRLRDPNAPMVPLSLVYEVDPGETQSLERYMIYVPEAFSGLIFESPGTYPVSVAVRCGAFQTEPKVLAFPAISVRVRPPGPEGLKAMSYLNSLPDVEAGRAMIRDLQVGVATPQTAPLIQGLLEAAPAAPLAPYALYALANKAQMDKRHAEAVRLGEELQKRFPSNLLADDALLLVRKACLDLGQDQKARDTVVRLYLNYPDSNVLQNTSEFFKTILAPRFRPVAPLAWTLFDPLVAPVKAEWLGMLQGAAAPPLMGPMVPSGPVTGPPAPGEVRLPNVLLDEADSTGQ